MYRFRTRDAEFNDVGVIERRNPNGSLHSEYTQPRFRFRASLCKDEVKVDRDDRNGDFLINRHWSSGPLNGTFPIVQTGGTMVLKNYIPQSVEGTLIGVTEVPYGNRDGVTSTTTVPAHLPNEKGLTTALTQTQANTFATQVVMRSNPSKPYASLPVFVGELRDLPRAIRQQGKDELFRMKRGGLDSVGVHYGILPIVSDLLKLTHFSEQVDRRIKELGKMREEGGFRKKVWILKRYVTKAVANNLSNSLNQRVVSFGGGRRETTTINSIWGVIRWEADATKLPPKGSDEERKLIKATLQGMTSRKNLVSWLSDAWEIMPWSWMVDWYSNIGDYLQAHSSALPAKPSQLHIMQHVRTERKDGPFLGGLTYLRGQEQKYRFKSRPSLTASLELLTPKQLSILGGIGLSRVARRNTG